MTKQEFENALHAYREMKTAISPKDYALIEKVYTFHPAINEVSGKAQVAMLYAEFGIRVFKDMEATADRAMILEQSIRTKRSELAKALDEYEELRRGEI